jgi:hypothetical protein
MSTPADKLHHWLMALHNDPEYTSTCERIGLAAGRDALSQDTFDSSDLAWMRQFHSALSAGVFPDAAQLLFVANAFKKYLAAGGEISLDKAFGLGSRQKAGNPSAKAGRDEALNRRCYEIHEYLELNPKATQEQAAESVQASLGTDVDVETMVRDFRRWKRSLFPEDSGK